MAIRVTCDNCGEMVPWMSGHQCRVTKPGKFAEPGPGFRTRPLYHETLCLPTFMKVHGTKRQATFDEQARDCVEFDRRIIRITQPDYRGSV